MFALKNNCNKPSLILYCALIWVVASPLASEEAAKPHGSWEKVLADPVPLTDISRPSSAPVAHPERTLPQASVPTDAKILVVYSDHKAEGNHYAPSGWMGDYGDIGLDSAWANGPQAGWTCIRNMYKPKAKSKNGWAGIYWQEPANNWGRSPGGLNLRGAQRLVFWARGEKGGEKIKAFKVGGIKGRYDDTAEASIGPIVLEKEWKRYEIPLRGKRLKRIAGGFCWVASGWDNREGMTFYLDEIQYEW